MREEGEKKRKLAQASVKTAISAKAWGDGEAEEGRGLMPADALQREKRERKKGKEEKRKLM